MRSCIACRLKVRRVEPFKVLTIALSCLVSSGVVHGNPANAQAVTFQQILNDPDNLKLNLEYARQQVESGALQQAASALERLLLHKPNWDSVRLFYGVVLYRLDDLKGAERELMILEGRGLSPSQENDRLKYLALARHQNASTRISAVMSIGGRWDSNPGRITNNPGGVPFFPAGISEDADKAVSISKRMRIESDIASGQGDYWFGQSDTYVVKYSDTSNANIATTTFKTGFTFNGENKLFVPYLFYGKSLVNHAHFRSRWGGGAQLNFTINPQTEFFAAGEYAREDYHLTSFSPVGNQRDGYKVTGKLGVVWRPSDTRKITIEGMLGRKDAQFSGFSYNVGAIKVSTLTLLGKGRYLTLSGKYTLTNYDQPDLFYSNTITREDKRLYGRAAYGAPLGTIFANQQLPDALSDIVAQVGVSWTSQDSSIAILDFDNLSADLMFTKRVEF